MKLTIPERLSLLDVLPVQGNFVTLKVVHELRMKLAFTEEEIAKWRITNTRSEDGRGVFVTWDEDFKDIAIDIPISDVLVNIVKRELMRFDQESRLRTDMIQLYERFVNGKKTESET